MKKFLHFLMLITIICTFTAAMLVCASAEGELTVVYLETGADVGVETHQHNVDRAHEPGDLHGVQPQRAGAHDDDVLPGLEVGLFGDYTVRVDESVKAVERMNTILGDAMVGGNLIVDKGFVVGKVGAAAAG